jgi:hypothetical protein
MTRIAAFCLVSAALAVLAVPASGGDVGKLKAAATGLNRQIQAQPAQGNPNQPVVIGGVYNGGSNAKVLPGKSSKERAPQH